MKNLALLLSVAVVTFAPWSSNAQETGERKRIRVINGREGKLQSNAIASPPTAGTSEMVLLQFNQTADVRDVLGLYATLTRQRLVYTEKVKGPCVLVLNELVPREKALPLIEKALFANGFTLIDLRDGTLEVTGTGESPLAFPVPVFTKLENLPEQERVVRMVFNIRHRDVNELAQQLMITCPPSPYMAGMTCIPDPKSKTLIVTERTSKVREISKIVEQFDVFNTQRLVKISLIMIGAATILLLTVLPFVGNRAGK